MSSLLELGIICTAIVTILGIAFYSVRKYKVELENEGRAVSILGTIGSYQLEDYSFKLVLFAAILPGFVLGYLLMEQLSPYLDRQIMIAIAPFLLIIYIMSFVVAIGYLAFTINGRSRRRATKVLREYRRNHRAENNLRTRLTELAAGDTVDRATVRFISKRGCTASIIAKEVLAAIIQEV